MSSGSGAVGAVGAVGAEAMGAASGSGCAVGDAVPAGSLWPAWLVDGVDGPCELELPFQ